MPNLRELELSLIEMRCLSPLIPALANLQYLHLAASRLSTSGSELDGMRLLVGAPFRSLRHLDLDWNFTPAALAVFVKAPWIRGLSALKLADEPEDKERIGKWQVLAAASLPALLKFELEFDYLPPEALADVVRVLDAAPWRAQCGRDFVVESGEEGEEEEEEG